MKRLRKIQALVITLALAGVNGFAQSNQSESWRHQPPASSPARPLTLPASREITLDNGLSLVLVEDHRAPIVTMYAGVTQKIAWQKGGMGLTDKMTLVEATADLLTEAQGPAYDGEVESLGAQIDSNAGVDYALMNGAVISNNAGRFLELFAEALTRPKFLNHEVTLYKNSRIDKLVVERQDAATLVREQFNHLVYGAAPYAYTAPTPQSVRALSRVRMEQFYRASYSPANTTVVIVGDFDPAAMQAKAQATLGQWRAIGSSAATNGSRTQQAANGQSHGHLTGARRHAIANATKRSVFVDAAQPPATLPQSTMPRRVYLIDRPGSEQADFRVGNLGLSRADADYYPLLVANAILGDGTGSRLFLNIREQQGFAYDVSSTISALKSGGAFFGNAESRSEVTAAAIRAMLSEFQRMRDTPVSDDDLRNAKNYLTGLFSLSLATQGGIADELLTMKLVGLGADYLKNYRDRIEAVTAADVQRVAQKYVHADDATIVIVGDAARLRKDLAALGPVVLVKSFETTRKDGARATPQ
jgi:zinc protease